MEFFLLDTQGESPYASSQKKGILITTKGETIHKEFLDEKGEGLHHILFKVRDYDATLEKFAKKGIDVLQQDRWVGGGGLAYMGTDKIGGIIMEVVQFPPGYDPKKGAQYVTD